MSAIFDCFKKFFQPNEIPSSQSCPEFLLQENNLELNFTDPYELRAHLRSVIRETSRSLEMFLLLQKNVTLEEFEVRESEIKQRLKTVIRYLGVINDEYHFLLQYLCEKLLEILEEMLFCRELVKNGTFELYHLIMMVRGNLTKINAKWKSKEKVFFNESSQNIEKEFNEDDVLIKQMHNRSIVNQLHANLDQFYEVSVIDQLPNHVKRRALELNLITKIQNFHKLLPEMLKENHFLLIFLFDKLRKSILNALTSEKFRLQTSNELLQLLTLLT